jgi:hypothetical protein
VFSLHAATGDKGDGAFGDDDLVGEELMAFGFAGVEADYEKGVVVAVVVELCHCESGGDLFGFFDEFGFALLEVGGGVDGGGGRLGECGNRGEEKGRNVEDFMRPLYLSFEMGGFYAGEV